MKMVDLNLSFILSFFLSFCLSFCLSFHMIDEIMIRTRAILSRYRHRPKIRAIRERFCLHVCRPARDIPAGKSRPKPWWCASSSRPVLTVSTRSTLNGSGGCLPSGANALIKRTTLRWLPAYAHPCRGRILWPDPSGAAKWPVPLRPTFPIQFPVAERPALDLIWGRTRRGCSIVHPGTPLQLRTMPTDTLPAVWAVAVCSPPNLITWAVYPEEPTGLLSQHHWSIADLIRIVPKQIKNEN